jgi:NitT/TauT family transport system permease protein
MASGAAIDPIGNEQGLVSQAQREDRRDLLVRSARQTAVFGVFIAALGALYTGYKAFASAVDGKQTDWPVIGSFLPRGDDLNMPPLTDIVGQFGAQDRGGQNYTAALIDEGLFTLREAAVGFVAGLVLGLGIAIVLARWKPLERGLLPYVIASQTIPLIAIAPIIVIWGRKNFDWLPWEWQDWMSVSIIATYLTFFPVAVNGLRGLQSPSPDHLELMDSYAASWGQTLWRLRLPASVPYLFAAFKIAATASIVGAIVGEISAGVAGGLGRRLLGEALNYTTGPERLYAAVVGSAVLGIAVFLFVTALERLVLGRQNREAL